MNIFLLKWALGGFTIETKENCLDESFFHTITVTVILVLCGLMTFVLSGCPEAQNMMQPVVGEPEDTEPPVVMGEVKKPEDKPAEPAEEAEEDATEEPSEPAEEAEEDPAEEAKGDPEEEPEEEVVEPEDTTPPTILEVSWYRDWRMTQPLRAADSVVHPGDTVYTTVIFSEPVVHTVANDETARPALFIVIDGMATRYRMLSRGSGFRGGEEAKPRSGRGTDYLCKYTIPAGIVGTPALRVGSTTTDIAGNAAETSVHTAPFTITEPEPELPEPHENDFTGQVVIPTADQVERGWRVPTRPVAGVTLTVLSGERAGEQSVTDEDGNYRFADRARETRSLRLQTEKEGFEPKEVIVHRSRPTETIDDGVHFSLVERKLQETPGTILVGHAWPDKVQFILEETALPHDLILVRVEDLPGTRSGSYGSGVIVVENRNCLVYTIAHELGHAHQHALAVIEEGPNASVHEWEHTSEGIAYLRAREKDWAEVGKAWYDGGRYLTPIENMAETAKFFWNIRGGFDTPQCFSTMKITEEAPNRVHWAQEWLGKQYD